MLNAVRGVPWDHKSNVEQGELPAEKQLQPFPEGERLREPSASDGEVIRRDFKIFRSDVLERQKTHGDGFTPDCPGCNAIRAGSSVARNHSNTCRERYSQILMSNDKTRHRVVLADRRLGIGGEAQASVPPPPVSVPDGSVEPAQMDSEENFHAQSEAVKDEPNGSEESMDLGLIAQIAIEHIKYGSHVAEVFSPPRVTALAGKSGLKPGFALDLTQLDTETGRPWDFSSPSMRERAWNLQDSQKPFLLVGSPPCKPFSSLFDSNASKMNPEARKKIIREGIVHMNFCVKMYHKQISNGGYFLHEHPWSAWSWQLPAMQALMKCEGVQLGKGHMCRQGMHIKTVEGELPALKSHRLAHQLSGNIAGDGKAVQK